ncbi:sensor histidine kinase [Mucilaginibacter sp.]|uniref:sensor histidine kinase n=1 Tax=Mucilaginibacter sp. TaxID=1882438 RepID=UPI002ED2AEEE
MDLSERLIRFNQTYRVVSHVLFWLLVLMLQYSSAGYYNPDGARFMDILLAVGTNQVAQMAAAYFLTYFIVPRYIYKQKYLPGLTWFAISIYVICVLSRLVVVHVEEPFYGVKAKPNETYQEIFTDLPKLIYVYFFRIYSVAFVFMLLKLLKDQLSVQQRALTLEKQKAEAELKLLKTQLNPHFLFNTLNNIYALALMNAPVTAGAIGRLSEILDYILYRCNNIYVPLSGEVALLNNYIGLEKLRYDERLTVNFSCHIDEQVEIAPLILLAIVENAFKHGAGNDIGEPKIDINLKTDPGHFAFTVSNTFQPKDEKNGTSIGLSNLKHQLELVYPGNHELTITEMGSLFIVKLTIKLA